MVRIPDARLHQVTEHTGTSRPEDIERLLGAAASGQWCHGPAGTQHLAVWWSADLLLWSRLPENALTPTRRVPSPVTTLFAPLLGCWLRAVQRRLWSSSCLDIEDLPKDPAACPVVGAWGLWWRSETLRLVALLPRRRLAVGRPTARAQEEALLVRFLGGGAIVLPHRGLVAVDRTALWSCGLEEEALMVVHPDRTDTVAQPAATHPEATREMPAAQATA